jgi:quercetin dioxygenase-like cupin family protein
MEIKRFGPGFRRPGGPPGTQGVSGQVIYQDERALVSELAFQRYAIITPHANQANTALFIVISGGGFVQVGEERARVNHGEAVVWPPGVIHGAYTDGTEMRVLIVELVGDDGVEIVDGVKAEALTEDPAKASPTKAEGELAERTIMRDEYDSHEGEPW